MIGPCWSRQEEDNFERKLWATPYVTVPLRVWTCGSGGLRRRYWADERERGARDWFGLVGPVLSELG